MGCQKPEDEASAAAEETCDQVSYTFDLYNHDNDEFTEFESNTGLTLFSHVFKVELSGESNCDVALILKVVDSEDHPEEQQNENWATWGEDFSIKALDSAEAEIVIPAGETEYVFGLTVYGDNEIEGDEQFGVMVVDSINASGDLNTVIITIIDEDISEGYDELL